MLRMYCTYVRGVGDPDSASNSDFLPAATCFIICMEDELKASINE